MGSYVTGTLVALCMVFGLYATHEASTGNTILGQDRLRSLSEEDLRALAEDVTSPKQIEAILQLGKRPGDLQKTVPILATLATSRNEMVKNSADASLEEIGADAAEHLRVFVDQDTTLGYRISCSAMRAIGSGSRIYLPEIKRLLEDDNPLHRKCGLYALQGMGEDGKEAMKEIIICVLDRDLNNQCSACRILEKFGNDAIEAEESLLKLQKKGGPSSRGWAAICLGAIGPTSSEVDIAQSLADQLVSKSDKSPVPLIEQQRVLIGLAYLGPEAIKVVNVVREKLLSHDKLVRGYAAYALWRITGKTNESAKVLRDLLNDPSYVNDGIHLVGIMGSDGLGLIEEVSRGLDSVEPTTREVAVVAIGNLGTAAKSYEENIRARLEDSNPSVRIAARRALVNLAK